LPDPDFLFLSDKHQIALDLLELAIFNHSGFCVISGEIGAGKTTLIRELLNRLDERINVGLVSNTHRSFGELLQWVLSAFALPRGDGDKLDAHRRFIDYVIDQYAQGKHTLLIIDEAQNLSIDALEELRMLSNVNSEKDLVLQVLLVGQGELREQLRNPALVQFAQRIALDYHLNALSQDETRAYIQHRLQHAGGDAGLFSESASEYIFQLSGGIPRLINRLCDLSLVYGYADECPLISIELVRRMAADQRTGRFLAAVELADDTDSFAMGSVAAAGSQGFAGRDDTAGLSKPENGEAAELLPVPTFGEPEPAASDSMPVELQAESFELQDEQTDQETADRQPDEEAPVPAAITADDEETLVVAIAAASVAPEADELQNEEYGAGEAGVSQAVQAPTSVASAMLREMSSILLPQKLSASNEQVAVQDKPVDQVVSHPIPDLHSMVVSAENQRQRSTFNPGVLWLMTAVVGMVAVAGWLARDWVSPYQTLPKIATSGVAREDVTILPVETYPSSLPEIDAAEEAVSLTVQAGQDSPPSTDGVSDGFSSAEASKRQAGATASITEETGTPADTAPVDGEVADTKTQADTAREKTATGNDAVAAAVAAEAAAAQARREAELKSEAKRLEKLQLEVRRLEQERLAAERVLAEQHAARAELERRAAKERERVLEAQKAAQQLAEERTREQDTAAAIVPGNAPAASGSAAVISNGAEQDNTAEAVRFSGNPCNGPTARFLSTCR
jgi:type II secretory pathway predicted ATPase ExeA